LGNVANGSGIFTMNDGSLSITNAGGNTLIPGNAAGTTGTTIGTFNMNGGVLTCLRNASTFFQDSFQPGLATNSVGTFNLNGGTANFLCGIEIGILGNGSINVTNGTLIDNGWFGVARGSVTNATGK